MSWAPSCGALSPTCAIFCWIAYVVLVFLFLLCDFDFSMWVSLWDLVVVAEKVLACWAHLTDGTVHTAAGDQASDWRPPALAERDLDGSWEFIPSGVPPSFSLRDVHSDSGSDDDSAASDAGGAMQIVTANGTFSYTEDWNHIERSRRPTLAAANPLHHARQRTGTSPAGGLCAGRLTRRDNREHTSSPGCTSTTVARRTQ